jgi:hypothetical protein
MNEQANEKKNPLLQNFLNSLQGSINRSEELKNTQLVDTKSIFKLIKEEKDKYMKTLVSGEENGHCKGIK